MILSSKTVNLNRKSILLYVYSGETSYQITLIPNYISFLKYAVGKCIFRGKYTLINLCINIDIHNPTY